MAGRRAAEGSRALTLAALAPGERAQVLDALVAARPELAAELERLAAELLASVSIDDVASEVEGALTGIPLDGLAVRAGRVRGRGYVHETDAAWELIEEAVEPFRSDLRRRAELGSLDAAADLAVGILAGLYLVRVPEMGTVLAYAGADAPSELASEVSSLAARLGVEIPADAAEDRWPDWCDLG